MLSKRCLVVAGAAAAFLWLVAAQPHAQTVDQRVYFTFSGPIELPGVGLPAGKYMFHLAEPTNARDVVQVASMDGKKIYGTFFTKSVDRFDPAPKAEVRFMETAAGTPPPIRTYWLPGERTGKEFIYPKQQARRLAKFTKEAILTTKAETTKTEETRTSELVRVSSSSESEYSSAPAPSAPLSGQNQTGEIVSDSNVAATSGSVQPQGQVARASLPQTASQMPLVGLIGLAALAFGALVRFRRTDAI